LDDDGFRIGESEIGRGHRKRRRDPNRSFATKADRRLLVDRISPIGAERLLGSISPEQGGLAMLEAPSLKVIFVRHGRRTYAKKHKDENDPLDESEREEVVTRRETLEKAGVSPCRVFTSRFRHARDTADILCENFEIVEPEKACELTPKCPVEVDEMFSRIESSIEELNNSTFLLVGHDPRLRQLITQFTGARLEPLDYLDMVCIVAGSAKDLRLGRAKVCWRYPVRNTSEADLRQKVTSKMTVATFLAGFTFTSLGFALADLNVTTSPASMPLPVTSFDYVFSAEWNRSIKVAALLFLSLSIGLFVGAVYVYDQLAMPRGLWDAEGKDSLWSRWFRTRKLNDNVKKNGYLYAHMVMAWSRLFTPAVSFAAVGFGLLITARSVLLAGLYLLALTLAGVWYRLNKPRVGLD
jgi:phosphohistidine phosphatase SixA